MSATITIKQYKKLGVYMAKTQPQTGIVPMIIGNHGIGKTQITEWIANELGYNYVVLNLANQGVEELLGFPNGMGGYHLPEWVVSADREEKRPGIYADRPTLYFLDEINRGQAHVLQCMFNFINEGRIHTFTIAEDDVIFAAGNPVGNDYDVTDFEDKAYLDRFAHFNLEPHINEFLEYLNDQGTPRGFLEAISSVDGLKSNAVVGKHIATPSYRGIDKMRKLANLMSREEYDSMGLDIMSATLGMDLALVLHTSMANSIDTMTADDILEVTDVSGFTFDPEAIDQVTALSMQLTDEISKRNAEGIELTDVNKTAMKLYTSYIQRDAEAALIASIIKAVSIKECIKIFGAQYVTSLLETA